MKRFLAFALTVALFFTFQIENVFAASSLDQIVNEQVGVKYKYGGATVKGFDCSGFTMFVFKQMGYKLPHQSKAQSKVGKAVKKDQLRPGDLLFFNTGGKGISHVGIYLGDGEFIHSSSNHGVVKNKLNEKYYLKTYVSASRILGETDYKEYTAELDEADADIPDQPTNE